MILSIKSFKTPLLVQRPSAHSHNPLSIPPLTHSTGWTQGSTATDFCKAEMPTGAFQGRFQPFRQRRIPVATGSEATAAQLRAETGSSRYCGPCWGTASSSSGAGCCGADFLGLEQASDAQAQATCRSGRQGCRRCSSSLVAAVKLYNTASSLQQPSSQLRTFASFLPFSGARAVCAGNPVKTRFTFLRQDFNPYWGRNLKTSQKTTLTIIFGAPAPPLPPPSTPSLWRMIVRVVFCVVLKFVPQRGSKSWRKNVKRVFDWVGTTPLDELGCSHVSQAQVRSRDAGYFLARCQAVERTTCQQLH